MLETWVVSRTQEVQCFVSDNRRLLNSVYLLYADPSEHGALITLDQFRYTYVGLTSHILLLGWRAQVFR